jgi:hypothetical protein
LNEYRTRTDGVQYSRGRRHDDGQQDPHEELARNDAELERLRRLLDERQGMSD